MGFIRDLPAHHGPVSLRYCLASAAGTGSCSQPGWHGSAGDALRCSGIATNSHQDQRTAKERAIYLPTRRMSNGFTFDSLNRFTIRYICTIELRVRLQSFVIKVVNNKLEFHSSLFS